MPAESPRRLSTPSPAVASPTASQVLAGVRCRSSTAASTGVSTTYMPVTKPDTDADVVASPCVCSSWATAYTAPSSAPRRRARASGATVWRRSTTSITTAAIQNRTARKSAAGTVSRTSLMRKKVEPQTAVIAVIARVGAQRSVAEVAGGPGWSVTTAGSLRPR